MHSVLKMQHVNGNANLLVILYILLTLSLAGYLCTNNTVFLISSTVSKQQNVVTAKHDQMSILTYSLIFYKVKLYSHSHENGLSRSVAISVSRSLLRPRTDGVLIDEPLPPPAGRYNK